MTPDWTVSCSMPVKLASQDFLSQKKRCYPKYSQSTFFHSEVKQNPSWQNELHIFINSGGKWIISWHSEDTALEKTSFSVGVTFPPVSKKEVCPKRWLLPYDRINHSCSFSYDISDQWTAHTHTHTHTHTHLLTLSPVQTKPAFTDTRWCSQTEAAGHRWRQRLAWRFHAGDFLFSSHRLFCFYFFPLLCKVRAVTRPPTQTPLAVQENFSRTQNTWKFLWPANGNLRIDNATNHSSHETR